MILYVSIGNSDDKLTQHQWADFCTDLHEVMEDAGKIHGEWFSASDSPYQNACICAEVSDNADVDRIIRSNLADLAYGFSQDSIALAVVASTEMILPAPVGQQ